MQPSVQTPTKRIEYIDALRGFTMILVVFSHVELFSFGLLPENSLLNSLFIQFRMPLFFFISGYIAYRADKIWDGTTWFTHAKKKVLIQLLPTIVFGLSYVYTISSSDATTFFLSPLKFGYWFTISLLEMFLIYYTINYLVHKFSNNQRGGELPH